MYAYVTYVLKSRIVGSFLKSNVSFERPVIFIYKTIFVLVCL